MFTFMSSRHLTKKCILSSFRRPLSYLHIARHIGEMPQVISSGLDERNQEIILPALTSLPAWVVWKVTIWCFCSAKRRLLQGSNLGLEHCGLCSERVIVMFLPRVKVFIYVLKKILLKGFPRAFDILFKAFPNYIYR